MMKSEDKKELGERLVKLAQSELETLKKYDTKNRGQK